MTRLGYQIPNFTYPDVVEAINEPPAISHIPVMIGRWRREEDAEDGGAIRRRVEHHLSPADIDRKLEAYFQRRGTDLAALPNDDRAALLSNFTWGDPETVGEKFASLLQPGIDGFTVNMPANGHIEDRVSLLGQTLAPLLT